MYYTSQPMEMVNNREALELTFKMIMRRRNFSARPTIRAGIWTCRA
jgi:hypothetical protein